MAKYNIQDEKIKEQIKLIQLLSIIESDREQSPTSAQNNILLDVTGSLTCWDILDR